jgi:hypothetical protein
MKKKQDINSTKTPIDAQQAESSLTEQPVPLDETLVIEDEVASAQKHVENLKEQAAIASAIISTIEASEQALNALTFRDTPALRKALHGLQKKTKDRSIDLFFRARITSMVETINLFLDPDLGFNWRKASEVAARAQGRNMNHARNLRSWIHRFLSSGDLPMHHYGEFHSSMLDDEDFSNDLQAYLLEISAKDQYISPTHVVDFVQTSEVQRRFQHRAGGPSEKVAISERTAQRWLKRLDWRYGLKKKGMYIDGHERDDVVAYRKAFCKRWKEYEKRMVIHDYSGNVIREPTYFAVPQGLRFRLIVVTHDESTFYARDRRKAYWQNTKAVPKPERKGEGESLMVSEFLTSEWGRLIDQDGECVPLCSLSKF